MYAVITGASRGIGKALAYQYGKNGFDLILTCEKNADLLADVANDIKNKYKKHVFTKVGRLSDSDIEHFENDAHVDIKKNLYMLINNAGKCDYNTIDKITDEKYKDLVYSNLDYAFFTTKVISKYLIKEKRGIIINITSMWGILGSSCEVVYSMTKGGLIAFTKALSKELKESSVDVIAFALGAVETDMIKEFLDDESLKKFAMTLDNKRLYTPSEISEIIYDKVSKKIYKSGDIIEINNGLK